MSRTKSNRLASFSTLQLVNEIYHRQGKGELIAYIITPMDIAEYWECDDAGSTHPGSRMPEEGEEMLAILRATDRWMEHNYSDLMYVVRDAFHAEQARQLDKEDSK